LSFYPATDKRQKTSIETKFLLKNKKPKPQILDVRTLEELMLVI
jgi:hypothetical protein